MLVLIYSFFLSTPSYSKTTFLQIEQNCTNETNLAIEKKVGDKVKSVAFQSPSVRYIFQTLKEMCLVKTVSHAIKDSRQDFCSSTLKLPQCLVDTTKGKFKTIAAMPLLIEYIMFLTKSDQQLEADKNRENVLINMYEEVVTVIDDTFKQSRFLNSIYTKMIEMHMSFMI
jgi:hypothetical protein